MYINMLYVSYFSNKICLGTKRPKKGPKRRVIDCRARAWWRICAHRRLLSSLYGVAAGSVSEIIARLTICLTANGLASSVSLPLVTFQLYQRPALISACVFSARCLCIQRFSKVLTTLVFKQMDTLYCCAITKWT